ncbi:siderophore ABC transporter substrate-binding protein [Actinomyces oricola]|uniref:siderophore ABC transporter substrate-binding protein n=1 Tax=Actinomyces oricola TaxID=206043 RepID=UPI0013E8CC28|nr:ABC transporter substrate-binding protein [Actinomyces oricola]
MTTRRSFLYLAAAVGTASLAACSSGSSSDAGAPGSSAGASAGVTPDASAFPVTVTHGKGELALEAAPEKVVVLDIAAMDTLVALGVSDRVVGIVSNGDTLPTDLGDYYASAEVVGTLHEPDAEKIDALGPDLVIVGGRSADTYDSIAQNFTALLMPGSRETAFGERLTGSAELLGQVFGVSSKATEELAAYTAKTEEVKATAQGIGKGLILMTSGGEVTAFGPGSRFGLIHDDLGVTPAIEDVEAATHGEAISFELINNANPDWLFVIDRDAAIGESGQAAKEVLNTELVTSTTAWTKNQVAYLDGQRWYIIGAGLHNAPAMVDEISTAITA